MLPKPLLFLVLILLSRTVAASAEDSWLEVRSPHFRVLTDASANDGRTVANGLEQIKHIFGARYGNGDNVQFGPPLTVFAVRSESTFRELRPGLAKVKGSDNIAGEFESGWEKQFAIIRLDSWGDQGQVVVYHEFTHSFFHANSHWLPVWLDEGIAEFYAYTKFQHDRILVGAPSLRSRTLADMALIPVATMLDVDSRSPYYHDPIKVQQFYAEAWAMVHYMTFGAGMGNGAKLGQFVKLLQQDTPQQKAFAEVFGDQRAFYNALTEYVHHFTFVAGVFPLDRNADPKDFTVRKLSPVQTAYELGCFHIGTHDHEGGRVLIEKALALDPKLAPAHEELGYLDFDAGKDQTAAEEWRKAIELDPSLPRSLFALTMSGIPVSQRSDEQLRETRAKLRHVVELDPAFAPAFAELALIEWRLHAMQPAYNDAHRAEILEPRRAGYRLLTGRILLSGNQPAVAATYARYVAEHWLQGDHNEAIDLWQDVPVDKRGEGPALTPDMPPGTKMERGTLTEISCSTQKGEKTRFTVRPATVEGANLATSQLLILSEGDQFRYSFSDTFWWGEDHFSLCRHLVGHPVVFAYKPDTKQIEDLEIRDELLAGTTNRN